MEPPHPSRRISFDLISLASPPRPSSAAPTLSLPHTSLAQDADNMNEKASSLDRITREQGKKRPPSLTRQPYRCDHPPSSAPASTTHWTPYVDSARQYQYTPSSSRNLRESMTIPAHSRANIPSSSYQPRRKPYMVDRVRPWFPLIITELFTYLDELSLWLRADEQYGHAILFGLIFLTTIPPIPLYSTFIILSGYTFGAWAGAIISYFAALSGALVVFTVSRYLFNESIERWLESCVPIKRVVRAIDRRPKLLFLIRLAPYPYNVMNCLLAASPTLTLHTYTVCTALSLFKVIIHTSVGASIHSFREYQNTDSSPSSDDESQTDMVARLWTILGILLCILILVYLSVVARRAVDEELEDLPDSARDPEERLAFLDATESDVESALPSTGRQMSEISYHR
ncbi:hypothetical protein CVT26_000190 [Gymnopilus dilepis]|uniref:Golgi apparatus membrane protein TVP38 n=1 Tax=Gymnopilus dilepis TaxID=231916 RepID=A0A409VG25_9AGAR|nr:hypothetical protein CVT26_000190 [Gymnopilus dilepis]